MLLPPANEVCEGYVFTGVCLSKGGVRGCSWGAYIVAPRGGMRGCSWGAWLLPGGHVWLLPGGHVWLLQGACVVAPRGVHGCSRGGCMVALGVCGCSQGACVVALGGVHGCSRGHAWVLWGCAWLLLGGMHGCSGGACKGYDEIWRYGQ